MTDEKLPHIDAPFLDAFPLPDNKRGAFRVIDSIALGSTVVGVFIADYVKHSAWRWPVIISGAFASGMAASFWKDHVSKAKSRQADSNLIEK